MDTNTLTITDNRTGKQYEIGIENDTIKALDLRKIKVADDDFGLITAIADDGQFVEMVY